MTTNSEAMLYECLDEVEDVLRSWQHRRINNRRQAWASTTTRAYTLAGRTVTMKLTVDVTAPANLPDVDAINGASLDAE